MTPLAHRIVKELTLPIKDRKLEDTAGLLKRMSDIHCFDTSEVFEAAWSLASEMNENRAKIGPLAFLPAPRTWIEWRGNQGLQGFLLEKLDDADSCRVTAAFDTNFASMRLFDIPLSADAHIGKAFYIDKELREGFERGGKDAGVAREWLFEIGILLYAMLALINTPRLIGRVTRLPHRGLEKALIARRKSVGHWPLHAWHEIKLSIAPPDAAPGEIEEGHLTGKRALHFCRAHLRIRLGRLELVSAHWRGDAQLGIKRARYAVVH